MKECQKEKIAGKEGVDLQKLRSSMSGLTWSVELWAVNTSQLDSRVESTDFTLGQYLTGILGMNPGEEIIKERTPDQQVMKQVVEDLELERFFEKPVSTLSNGQSRRARIGKALLTRPEVLCLDAPFSKCHTSFNG
jgi:ABC-type molybdenum transport system ATPase subunit/photorepair protein PhrA